MLDPYINWVILKRLVLALIWKSWYTDIIVYEWLNAFPTTQRQMWTGEHKSHIMINWSRMLICTGDISGQSIYKFELKANGKVQLLNTYDKVKMIETPWFQNVIENLVKEKLDSDVEKILLDH